MKKSEREIITNDLKDATKWISIAFMLFILLLAVSYYYSVIHAGMTACVVLLLIIGKICLWDEYIKSVEKRAVQLDKQREVEEKVMESYLGTGEHVWEEKK